MQYCIKILLFLILHEAQHVSGDTPPIIRSLKLHKQPLVLHNTVEGCWTCSCWTLSGSVRWMEQLIIGVYQNILVSADGAVNYWSVSEKKCGCSRKASLYPRVFTLWNCLFPRSLRNLPRARDVGAECHLDTQHSPVSVYIPSSLFPTARAHRLCYSNF